MLTFTLLLSFSTILDEETRELCRTAFGADIADTYGAEEAGHIAAQCRACGEYHVSAEAPMRVGGRRREPEPDDQQLRWDVDAGVRPTARVLLPAQRAVSGRPFPVRELPEHRRQPLQELEPETGLVERSGEGKPSPDHFLIRQANALLLALQAMCSDAPRFGSFTTETRSPEAVTLIRDDTRQATSMPVCVLHRSVSAEKRFGSTSSSLRVFAPAGPVDAMVLHANWAFAVEGQDTCTALHEVIGCGYDPGV